MKDKFNLMTENERFGYVVYIVTSLIDIALLMINVYVFKFVRVYASHDAQKALKIIALDIAFSFAIWAFTRVVILAMDVSILTSDKAENEVKFALYDVDNYASYRNMVKYFLEKNHYLLLDGEEETFIRVTYNRWVESQRVDSDLLLTEFLDMQIKLFGYCFKNKEAIS